MTRLETARAEWKRFDREDKPAFERWMATTFGPLLTRLRELDHLIHQKEALVHDVEIEMAWGGARTERTAYARIQKRRNQPFDAAGDTAEFHSSGERSADSRSSAEDDHEELSDFELELFFEEFLAMLGMNPDRMSDRQYARMFAEFKAKMGGKNADETPPKGPALPDAQPEPPKSAQLRIKELYRILVRRLHPDTRAENEPEVSMLWHEVQEAYQNGNLERLEMLLAFTDIQDNTTGAHTSLFQMQSVLAELKSALRALQKNLRAARKERAWGFARLADRAPLENRIQRELQKDLAVNEEQLRRLEALIRQWATPPRQRVAPPQRTQEFFPF